MLKPADRRKEPKPRPPRADCCPESECTTGLRNNYYVGKRLTPNAMSIEQRYLNRRRWLLNRAIHGCGVVCGFGVEPAPSDLSQRQAEPAALRIGDGLALDDLGRELLSVDAVGLRLADFIVLEKPGQRMSLCKGEAPWARSKCWRLQVHYAEKPVGEVPLHDPCGCSREAWDQVCETVRFSLVPVDCRDCCAEPECALECRCPDAESCCGERLLEEYGLRDRGPVLAQAPAGRDLAEQVREAAARGEEIAPPAQRVTGTVKPIEPRHPKVVARGGCDCLCHRELDLGAADCARLTEVVEPCGKVLVDLCHGVTLACVQVVQDRCGDWTFGRLDACGVRSIVKSNDVLFDLIRGCDLTRIVDARWFHFRRGEMVAWREFAESFHPGSKEEGYRGYRLEFSRRVFTSTLQADSFAITAVLTKESTGWGHVRRIPILGVEPLVAGGDRNFATGAILVVDGLWYDDEVRGPYRAFNCDEFTVEVEVRGERIIDCNGLPIDASGGGTPGTRSTVAIRVRGPEHPDRHWKHDSASGASPEPGQYEQGASS